MFRILDRKRKVIGLLQSPIEPRIEEAINGMYELYFSVPSSFQGLELEGYIQIENEHEYVIKEIVTHGTNREVVAIMNVEELFGNSWVTFRSVDTNVYDCMREILSGTNWRAVNNSTRKVTRSLLGSNTTSWDLISQFCSIYDVEVKFDTYKKEITIVDRLGGDLGVYFMNELNLKQLNHDSHTHKYITQVIPIGKNGMTIEDINDGKLYVTDYTYTNKKITGIWKADSYNDKQALKEDAQKFLAEMAVPYQTYECLVVDLNKAQGASNFAYGIGDIITLIDNTTNQRVKQRIIKQTRYLIDPSSNSIQIANKNMTFQDYYKKLQMIANMTEQIMNGDGTISTDKVEVGDVDLVIKADSILAEHIKAEQIFARHIVADNITAEHIKAEQIDTKHLKANIINTGHIQAGAITAGSGIVAEGAIGDAQISNLDVSKINAGNISTNKFSIKSDDGGIEIVGATQQFKDKNNNVRIQMGQDSEGDFNFIIRGEDGTTTLIDHTGIKEQAIADDLIKSNMVASNAIGEKQIDYRSFIDGFNEDTNTNTIKSTKITLDNQNQTLDVAFNQLKTFSENTQNQLDNLEIGGRNLFNNSNFSKITEAGGITDKNPNQYAVGWGGYNGWQENANSIYHAHIDNDTFNYNVYEFNESDGNRYWKGIQHSIFTRIKDDDSKYILSLDAFANNAGTKLFGGMCYYKKGTEVMDFYSGQFEIDSSKIPINNWERVSVEVPHNTDIDITKEIVFYIYGYGFSENAILYIKNVKLETGDKATDWTPSPEDLSGDINGVKEVVERNSTSIAVMQGEIKTAISNTQIVKDGQTVLLKDDYNKTVQTVDSMKSTIGSHTSLIDQNSNEILGVHNKTNDLERTVDSFSSRISVTEDTAQSAINKVSNIEQNIGSITNRVESVEKTQTTTDGKVTALETWKKSAEQKITDEAIVSTVSGSFYKKDQSDRLYASQSEVNQMANQISSKVDANGVNSIIKQNPDSIRIGFNGIDNRTQIDANGLSMYNPSGVKTTMLKLGNIYQYNGATGTFLGGYLSARNSSANNLGVVGSYYTKQWIVSRSSGWQSDNDNDPRGTTDYFFINFVNTGGNNVGIHLASNTYAHSNLYMQSNDILNAGVMNANVSKFRTWRDTGNVIAMDCNPDGKIYLGKHINTNGFSVSNNSDSRLKQDIKYVDEMTYNIEEPNLKSTLYQEFKNKFKFATYRYKREELKDREHFGFMAQDLLGTVFEKYLIDNPDSSCSEEDYLRYDLTELTTVIAGVLQEEISVRDKQIAELEDRLAKLEQLLVIS